MPDADRGAHAPPCLTGADVVAATVTSALAVAVLSSYLLFRLGWRVPPIGVLAASAIAAAAIAERLRREAVWRFDDIAAFAAIVLGAAAAVLWMAWPDLLPVGGGPDLTHHLVLINYIERNWQLLFDPALVPYLGDMLYYTPGSHLLVALAGAWTRSGGLHVVHRVLAVSVAIKAGLVFCVARRLLPAGSPRVPFAVAAALLLLLPYEYVVGSFAADSFWAQVVAETFACAAWWALVIWNDTRWNDDAWAPMMALVALFGAAAFVTWPIWIGPVVISVVVIVLWHGGLTFRTRLEHLSIALIPIAIVIVIHLFGRLSWLRIAATSGAVIRPSAANFSWLFLALSAAGLVLVAADRRGRPLVVLLFGIAVQALALFAVARARGADTPYLALKMLYLVPYPLAVAAAYALAVAWSRFPTSHSAWILVALIAILAGRRAMLMPRPAPIVTETTYQAGRWARDHVPRACVDYLVADGYTGYWLHLAVLDNPRNTKRMEAAATFEPRDALARWIETDGLPYAIVDDVRGFSKALFTSTDTLARFGPSAVVKRHGKGICEE